MNEINLLSQTSSENPIDENQSVPDPNLNFILSLEDVQNKKMQVIKLNRRELINKFHQFHFYDRKEKLYLTGIKNLLKKVNSLELFQRLSNDEMSEDEFEQEISSNKDLYSIEVNRNYIQLDVDLILGITNSLSDQLKNHTVNDISEMFSIPSEALLKITLNTDEG